MAKRKTTTKRTPAARTSASKTSRTRQAPAPAFQRRLDLCRAAMSQKRARAYLVTKPMDLFYLTGFTGEDSAALLTEKDVILLTDGRFQDTVRQECPWATIRIRPGSLHQEIADVVKELKWRSLAVQADGLSLSEYAHMADLCGSVTLKPLPDLIGPMRAVKDAADLAAIRRAIKVAEDAFLAFKQTIRLGQTELDLAAQLEYEMRRRGASGPAFPTICAEGANGALPHAQPGKRTVKKGCALLVDWGARVNMYCSDLTRMIFVDRVPPAFERMYHAVLEAQRRAIDALRPGAQTRDVDEVARSHVNGTEFKDRFTHGLGHGLGLDVHEGPSLSWRTTQPLEEGMLVTVEPGIYLPGTGGVRIEDDVLITSNGAQVLTRLSKSLDDAVLR